MATKLKRKDIRELQSGIAHIHATFNNTIVTVSDVKGNTISWSSAGSVGFKGARRSTSYAAQTAAEQAGKKASDIGVVSLNVIIKGMGEGRESAIRGLASSGLVIHNIEDHTPIAHNGCRPPKQRRV